MPQLELISGRVANAEVVDRQFGHAVLYRLRHETGHRVQALRVLVEAGHRSELGKAKGWRTLPEALNSSSGKRAPFRCS